ncbi:uncharacterized protein [Aristolochia californica]|uniref:uncharacterized protein n=1 Tax=Aristolochia californica TaxID=171875 RepID=UPI0035DEC13B
MANLRLKLSRLVRCHEESKAAFQRLKSQIEISLHEAEEVFASLSVPLMRFVGLKTEEMALEGRSSFIVFESDSQRLSCRGLAESEDLTRSSTPDDGVHCLPTLEDGQRYQARIVRARQELTAESRLHLQHLASLLRQIEDDVNSALDDYHQRLDDRHLAIQKLFQKSKAFLDTVHHGNRDPKVIFVATCKILAAVYEKVGSVFDSVKEDADELIGELGSRMCTPLAGHAKRLKADGRVGSTARLVSLAEELGRLARFRAAEAGEARRKANEAEEGRLEAERRLREFEEKVMRMKDSFGSYYACFEVEQSIRGDKAKLVEVDEKRLQEERFSSSQGPRQSQSSANVNLVRTSCRKYPLLPSPVTDRQEVAADHVKHLQGSRTRTTPQRRSLSKLYPL